MIFRVLKKLPRIDQELEKNMHRQVNHFKFVLRSRVDKLASLKLTSQMAFLSRTNDCSKNLHAQADRSNKLNIKFLWDRSILTIPTNGLELINTQLKVFSNHKYGHGRNNRKITPVTEPFNAVNSTIPFLHKYGRGRNNRKITPVTEPFVNSTIPFLLSGILAWLGLQEEEKDKESELVTTMKRGILAVRNEDLAKANQMFHIALRMAIDLGHEEAQTHIYCLLANCALEQEMYMQAERLFTTVLQRILAAGTKQDSNAVVEISLKLANIFMQHGDMEKAEHGFNFCLETMKKKMKEFETPRKTLAKPHVDGLDSTASEGESEVVEEEETLEDTVALWGMILDQRGQFCINRGKLSEAKLMFREAEGVSVRLHGQDHEQTLVITNSLATVVSMEGRYQEAVDILNKVVEKARQLESPFLATFLINLGLTKLRQGMTREARKWCGEGLELGRRMKDAEAVEQGQKCLLEVNT